MEKCPVCHKAVEDAPPNVGVHAECWLEVILERREKEDDIANTRHRTLQSARNTTYRPKKER